MSSKAAYFWVPDSKLVWRKYRQDRADVFVPVRDIFEPPADVAAEDSLRGSQRHSGGDKNGPAVIKADAEARSKGNWIKVHEREWVQQVCSFYVR